jgi:aspartate aminotransferase
MFAGQNHLFVMNRVAKRMLVLSESETLAMARRSRELKAQGKDVISLSIGEPDYDTPEFLKESAYKAIRENYTHYTPVAGFQELREAAALKFKRDNNIGYKPEQIVVSTGAKQSIANAIMSLVDEGDEVLLPAPYWVSYIEMVKLAGGTPRVVYAGLEHDFKVNPDMLRPFINEKTRMIVFSSPCNPTGSVYSREELKALASFLSAYPELIIISDEIYEHINFGEKHCSIASFDEVYNQTITVNGLSKCFAMTGWRLGYLGAPKWIADACDKFQGQITSGTNSIAQRVAIDALQADPVVIHPMVEGFHKRRDLMYGLLKEIDGLEVNLPKGAFYFFPNIEAFLGKRSGNFEVNTAHDLTMYLLNEHLLATVSGEAFGCAKSIRLSYATSEDQIVESVKRLKAGLEALQ